MEAIKIKQKEQPKITAKQVAQQELEIKKYQAENAKYMSYLQKLVSEYIDGYSDNEEQDKKLYTKLNKKWRLKSGEIKNFAKYIKANHMLFELFVNHNQEEGIKVAEYIDMMESKLQAVIDLHTICTYKTADFWQKFDDLLKGKVNEQEVVN